MKEFAAIVLGLIALVVVIAATRKWYKKYQEKKNEGNSK